MTSNFSFLLGSAEIVRVNFAQPHTPKDQFETRSWRVQYVSIFVLVSAFICTCITTDLQRLPLAPTHARFQALTAGEKAKTWWQAGLPPVFHEHVTGVHAARHGSNPHAAGDTRVRVSRDGLNHVHNVRKPVETNTTGVRDS